MTRPEPTATEHGDNCLSWHGPPNPCDCGVGGFAEPGIEIRVLPPLPTSLDDWHATVRLYRTPGYLRARADDIERRLNGELSPSDPRSVADVLGDLRNPSPEQLRARVDHLRAEATRLTAAADEIEERLRA